jgi:histidine triad (HIT) family protein
MNEADIGGLFRVASKVSKAVVGAVGADGFRFVQNNGEAANQVVAHVHVHVIPVKMEDKGRFMGRKSLTDKEMGSIAKAVREEIRVSA